MWEHSSEREKKKKKSGLGTRLAQTANIDKYVSRGATQLVVALVVYSSRHSWAIDLPFERDFLL